MFAPPLPLPPVLVFICHRGRAQFASVPFNNGSPPPVCYALLTVVSLRPPPSEVSDDDNSIALMYQTISDLPPANRDTLAFLVLHLKK